MNELEKYYNKFNEDKRLLSRHGQVEFFVATQHIENHIKEYLNKNTNISKLNIIDIGAGTGRYSAYFADMGHNLTAVEPVRKNLSQIQEKNPNIQIKQGNALKLKFKDEVFDIALLFGPTYHLFSHSDKLKTILEAKRVLKKGGILFIMYLTNEYAMITHAFKEGKLQESLANNKIDSNFHIVTSQEDLYSYVRIEDINKLQQDAQMERLEIIGVDGATDYIRPILNKMSEKDFDYFKQYQLSISSRQELIGASSHIMDVLIK